MLRWICWLVSLAHLEILYTSMSFGVAHSMLQMQLAVMAAAWTWIYGKLHVFHQLAVRFYVCPFVDLDCIQIIGAGEALHVQPFLLFRYSLSKHISPQMDLRQRLADWCCVHQDHQRHQSLLHCQAIRRPTHGLQHCSCSKVVLTTQQIWKAFCSLSAQ